MDNFVKNNRKFINLFSLCAVLVSVGLLYLAVSYSLNNLDVLDHLPLSGDVTSENLLSGQFNDNKQLVSNSNYVSYDKLIEMNSNAFMISLPDEYIRVEVREFDNDKNYIGMSDIAHLDYFIKNNETKYILLSFYKMDNTGLIVDTTYDELKNLLLSGEISFEELDDINTQEIASRQSTITTYLSPKTFMNLGNYKAGTHNTGWASGTGYTYSKNGISSRNYYKVVPGTKYYVSGSDSRYKIFISWRDKDGKWSKSAYDYKGGVGQTTVTAPSNAVAMSINVECQDNHISAFDLIYKYDARVSVDFRSYYYGLTPIVERSINFTDVNEWRPGNFGYTNGEYFKDDESYASKYLYKNTYGNKKMVFKSINEYLSLIIKQFSDTRELLSTTTLGVDRTITFRDDCAYYSMVITNSKSISDSTRKDFLNELRNGEEISFEEYVPYVHNTVMQDITNQEMLSNIMIGWNLGNSFESHNSKFVESTQYWDPESYWGQPYVTENVIKYVKSLGFNSIRIPVSYINNWYLDGNGNYVFRQEHIDRVKQVVDYALKYDMYVVINSHFDAGMSASPIKVGAENKDWERAVKYSKQLWTQVAESFKDYDEHLMFESYNEVDNPYVARTATPLAAAQMNELNQIFVDAVRATGGNNEKRILQVHTFLSTTGANALNQFEVPADIYPNKLIAHVHSYPSSWDEKVETIFNALDAFTQRTGLPVVVGEFGNTTRFSPSMYRYTVISNFMARARNHNVGVYVWDNGSDYALVYRKSLTSDAKYVDAIFNAQEYVTEGKQRLDKYEDFVCGKFNQSTGMVTNQYDGWGTIISDYIEVPENKQFLQLDLYTLGEAESRNLHYVYFYDENHTVIREKCINEGYPGFTSKFIPVPQEAKYVKFGINSSANKTRAADYERYFANGLLYLEYVFLNPEIDTTLRDTPLAEGETMLSDFYDFEWGMLYPGNGEVKVNVGWGEVSTYYIELADGQETFDYRFLRRASANVSVRHMAWYDADKKFLQQGFNDSSQNGRNTGSYEIPEGAKYVRLGITGLSNYHAPEYNMMFATGDCVLIYK